MRSSRLPVAVASILLGGISGDAGLPVPSPGCKSTPADVGWPSPNDWANFNLSVNGRLIATSPIALPCYQGPNYNPAACAALIPSWNDPTFRAQFPIGYSFSDLEPCDIITSAFNTTACSLGNNPVLAVDAATADHVSAAVLFAAQKNLRLSIKATGVDYLSRSTGFGSLEIWLRNMREGGMVLEIPYQPQQPCILPSGQPLWAGDSITINGSYTWSDVYSFAQSNGQIAVGPAYGGISAIGGYLQGGGHSAASAQYGLAADQLLEATVVLANGAQVTTSACQNPDLFAAIRGGGGGTFGIVTSVKVKSYPETPVAAVVFSMAALTGNDIPLFLDSITYLYQYFPWIIEAGLGGYAGWNLYDTQPMFGPAGPSFYLVMGAFNQTLAQVHATFDPIVAGLTPLNGVNLNLSVSYNYFPTYAGYFSSLFGTNIPASAGGIALTSRFLGAAHVSDPVPVRQMLNTTAGLPGQRTSRLAVLAGGLGVRAGASQSSGVNPAWRNAYVLDIVARRWEHTATAADVEAIHSDVTAVKGAALTALAPDTGSYPNEGDARDPTFLANFYGTALPMLEAAKAKYDPSGLFYCPTCVGSEFWSEDATGRLCHV
ncbi:uncharacterized protein E0L32_001246 [Thyridium curvatum]|uniref:FAD-binding PCMH-type domain-containing protein n=1 Tax=Thyridium curvatum TaxID=1093900 RepID=A0A507AYF1_9PEZI|nr:uncharacterized protein E0L32_001246 [Thyridium curvatum]TPX10049.1 hypothetical protein E0L32_001246 [Thyridium curvatum]